MMPPQPPPLAASIAAAQQWWRDAGMEFACGDEPVIWAGSETGQQAAARAPSTSAAPEISAVPPPPAMGGEPAAWPTDLEAFAAWWLTEPSLDCGGLRPKIAPRGAENAALMVLVPMPEAEDSETLLSGAQGRLIAGITAALELGGGEIYLASALPRHLPLPDWDALGQAGLGAVLRHHVTLARPKRVLAMGNGILPLLGHDPTQAPPPPDQSAIQDMAAPVLGTLAPDTLLRAPRSRAALWRQLLDWTET